MNTAIGATIDAVPLPPPRVVVQHVEHKTCPRCGEDKPASAYYVRVWIDRRTAQSVARQGLSPYCKPCTVRYVCAQQGTQEGEERKRAEQRRYQARDDVRQHRAAYQRAWVAAHRDHRRAYMRAWHQRRKEAQP